MIDVKKAQKKLYEDAMYYHLIHKGKRVVRRDIVYFEDKDSRWWKINFLYVIQNPCSMIKWFTTNSNIAGYANSKGWSVKCINECSKIIR